MAQKYNRLSKPKVESPVKQDNLSKPKAPILEGNNLTPKSNNTSMVKGNYPTSTSTALEVSQKPDTTLSQRANQAKEQIAAIDQASADRPRQPMVFQQDYMNVPYVRIEKKKEQEVNKPEIKKEPAIQTPAATVHF